MEMNVRDDQKLVEIWLTNAEKIDPVLREGLKEIYAKYKTKKYMVAVFESGKGDLYENTRDLLLFNRRRSAEKAVQRDGCIRSWYSPDRRFCERKNYGSQFCHAER